jgi:hypothetical protein
MQNGYPNSLNVIRSSFRVSFGRNFNGQYKLLVIGFLCSFLEMIKRENNGVTYVVLKGIVE